MKEFLIILKTNIASETDVDALRDVLDRHDSIRRWTVDLEDVDKVLRIEASGEVPNQEIIDIIGTRGFTGEELPD